MSTTKWLVMELETARKALDRYARHDGGCSTGRGRGEPCDCGLEAAKSRLREAVQTAIRLPGATKGGRPIE